MTTEQAIKELKSDRELYEGDIVYAGDGTPDGDLMLALDMGIAALKKQMPRKPICKIDPMFGDNCIVCSNCENAAIVSPFTHSIFKHCPNCGQALDWNGTDDYFENYNKEE